MKAIANVLVVEDDELIRGIFVDIIKSKGYSVLEGTNGREALQILEEQPINIIVSDMKMPVMDGLQLLREVKSKHPEIPVVVITGFDNVYTEQQVMAAGADAYVTKPFKVEDVSSTLQEVHQRIKQRLSQPLS
jgi:CheY-like chemotaxis protein